MGGRYGADAQHRNRVGGTLPEMAPCPLVRLVFRGFPYSCRHGCAGGLVIEVVTVAVAFAGWHATENAPDSAAIQGFTMLGCWDSPGEQAVPVSGETLLPGGSQPAGRTSSLAWMISRTGTNARCCRTAHASFSLK